MEVYFTPLDDDETADVFIFYKETLEGSLLMQFLQKCHGVETILPLISFSPTQTTCTKRILL